MTKARNIPVANSRSAATTSKAILIAMDAASSVVSAMPTAASASKVAVDAGRDFREGRFSFIRQV